MRRIYRLNIVLGLVFLLFSSVVSAQPGGWKVVSVERAQDLIGEEHDLRHVSLSPDGTMLAWDEERQVCLYNIEAAETACYPYPETFDGIGGPYWTFLWSPDSRSIALSEDVFVTSRDSDLWIFNVADGTFTNRTDDNFSGMWISLESGQEPPSLDYAPAWNPANGDLYFFRSIRYSDGGTIFSLNVLALGREEDKVAVDMTGEFNIFSVFLPPVISPDGKHLAFVMLSQDLTDPQNGVWTLDLEDGAHRQVMTIEQLSLGLPDWAIDENGIVYPDALRWVGNEALVATLLNNTTNGIPQAAYYIDLASGDVSPLTDFTDLASASDLTANLDQLDSPVYRLPRAGVVTPDGSAFIYLGAEPSGSSAVISAVSLPPGADLTPVQLTQIDDFQVSPAAASRPSISTDGHHALLNGYLITLEQE